MLQQSTVFLEDARRMIVGTDAKARDTGQPMNIAVVDNGCDNAQDQAVVEAAVAAL